MYLHFISDTILGNRRGTRVKKLKENKYKIVLLNLLLLSKQNPRFVALGPQKTISIKYTQGLQWGQSVNRGKDIFTYSCPIGQRFTLQNINLPILLVYAGQSEGIGQRTKEKGLGAGRK